MKRIVLILMTCVLVCSFLAVQSFAAGSLTISAKASKTELERGDTFSITFSVTENPGFTTLGIEVEYDSAAFELLMSGVDADGESIPADDAGKYGAIMHNPEAKSPYVLFWYNPLAKKNYTNTADLATLTFKVKNTADLNKAYDFTVRLLDDDAESALDCNMNTVATAFPDMKAFVSVVCKHSGGLAHTAAKAATCTDEGNLEYWYCSVCGDYFSDAAGKTKIEGSVELDALGHDLKEVAAKAETCTEDGNIAHFVCSRCDKIFVAGQSDDLVETTADAVTVKKRAHTMTKTDEVAANCVETGTAAYWSCSECGLYYADAAGSAAGVANKESLPGYVLPIDPTNHKSELVEQEETAPTCTTPGTNHAWQCPDCHKSYTDADGKVEAEAVADPLGHDYSMTQGQAETCTEDGWKTFYTCAREGCGCVFDENKTELEALKGKTIDEIKVADGIRIPATGHANLKSYDEVEADCVGGNYAYSYCPDCGLVLVTPEVAEEAGITGDNVTIGGVEYVVAARGVAANEDNNPSELPEAIKKELDPNVHTTTKFVADTAATCVAPAVGHIVCVGCGEVLEENIEDPEGRLDPNNHNYKNGTCEDCHAIDPNNMAYIIQYINDEYHGTLGGYNGPNFTRHTPDRRGLITDGVYQWYVCSVCRHEYGKTLVNPAADEEPTDLIVVEEPVESDNPEVEVDPEEEAPVVEPAPAPVVDTNPVTGIALAVLPAAIAAAAAMISKRR